MEQWDAVETAARIRGREVTAAEVVDAAISRAEGAAHLGGLVAPTFETARRAATTDPTGPLAGVPTAVKDLTDVRGQPTRFGSRAVRDYVARRTSPDAAQLLATGVVSLGKSATPELGMTATTEPLFGPPTRNPWNPEYSTGGSSGGAAALVAAGVVPMAHASDGGGSIRIPAAMCGLVGLKPSDDRLVRLEEMRGLPVRIAVHGVLTRTVRDTAAYLHHAEGLHRNRDLPPVGDVRGPSRRRLRVGVILTGPEAPVAPAVEAATRSTADRLADAGHHVVELPEPFGDGLAEQFAEDFLRYWALLALGGTQLLRRKVGRSFDAASVDPLTAGLARHARANLVRLPGSIARLRRFRHHYRERFTDLDVLVSPTVARTTPRLGHLRPDRPFEELEQDLRELVQFTPVHNVAGAPAVSLPAATHDGLPVGVMLSADVGDERTLLELAYELEQLAPWPRTAPTPAPRTVAGPPGARP
jgi:amidase